MKKKKAKSTIKRLQAEVEQCWKDYVYARDGNKCMVAFENPEIPLKHDNIMQADHCFSRNDKNLFVDPRNGTCVCRCCNMAKGFGQRSVARLIDDIVIRREGFEAFEEMKAINLKLSGSEKWRNASWLESQIAYLRKLKEDLNDQIKMVYE